MNNRTVKKYIAKVFDERNHTHRWEIYVNYGIVGLILLSTLEVFLSTYDDIVEQYGILLHFVDYFTTIVFTIEVSLRIWTADLIDKKYKGFWGRIRYCCSFYGLIDILSTYPFYLHYFLPVPYIALKVLRIARLLRIFRYMKAFMVLKKALASKQDEMKVSLQFLIIVTFILSFILFFVEHEAQPEVYDNGWTSVVWAFAQYIGDPGSFADTPPITVCGKVIACIIGVLGIAIFAVPAGLIASAFSEVMDEDVKEKNINNSIQQMFLAFERMLDRPTGFQIMPKFISMVDLQARMGLKVDDVIDAVAASPNFRLINTAVMRPIDQKADDKLAVEYFKVNTPYGCCINRKSKVTIFTPSNIVDPICGWWGYYLAKIGGFNYISREVGQTRPYHSFFNYNPTYADSAFEKLMLDMNLLLDSSDKWIFTILATSGMHEPEYPTQFHFSTGGEKGNELYASENSLVHDITTFDNLYRDFESQINKLEDLESEDGTFLKCDHQRYHGSANKNNFARGLKYHPNAVSLYIAWRILAWDTRAIQIAEMLAHTIHSHILPYQEYIIPKEMKVKDIGYNGYSD